MSGSARIGGGTPPVVGIFGHYGNENLGDEAIIEAVIARIRAERPDTDIRCFSVHPRDSSLRYEVVAYPIRLAGEAELSLPANTPPASAHAPTPNRPDGSASSRTSLTLIDRVKASIPRWLRTTLSRLVQAPRAACDIASEIGFLFRSYRRLRGVDALIIAGSNQFLDNFGGPSGFPYTLLKWSILARLANCKLLYASVGAGPLDSPLSRAMVRVAVHCAHYVSFRDAASKQLVQGRSSRDFGPVYPDLAHSLSFETPSPSPSFGRGPATKPMIGINPMPLYDERYWCATDKGRYRAYCADLAALVQHLLDDAYPVFFFPTQPKDLNVVRDILLALPPSSAQQLTAAGAIKEPKSVAELIEIITTADIVIATRFHGTLLALHARRPVIAICYYRKTRDLMREMGQEAYAVDFDDANAAEVRTRLERLGMHRAEEIDRISAVDDTYVAALEEQYRRILPIVLGTSPAESEQAPGAALGKTLRGPTQ